MKSIAHLQRSFAFASACDAKTLHLQEFLWHYDRSQFHEEPRNPTETAKHRPWQTSKNHTYTAETLKDGFPLQTTGFQLVSSTMVLWTGKQAHAA